MLCVTGWRLRVLVLKREKLTFRNVTNVGFSLECNKRSQINFGLVSTRMKKVLSVSLLLWLSYDISS